MQGCGCAGLSARARGGPHPCHASVGRRDPETEPRHILRTQRRAQATRLGPGAPRPAAGGSWGPGFCFLLPFLFLCSTGRVYIHTYIHTCTHGVCVPVCVYVPPLLQCLPADSAQHPAQCQGRGPTGPHASLTGPVGDAAWQKQIGSRACVCGIPAIRRASEHARTDTRTQGRTQWTDTFDALPRSRTVEWTAGRCDTALSPACVHCGEAR